MYNHDIVCIKQVHFASQLSKCWTGLIDLKLGQAWTYGFMQIEQLSSGTRIALDGSHTPESAETVAKTLEQVFPTKPIALIIAMADDKDHAGIHKISIIRK